MTEQNISTGKAHCSDEDEDPDFIKIRMSNVNSIKRKRKSSLSGNSKMMGNKDLQEDTASTRTNNGLPIYDDPMQAPDADQSPGSSDNVTFQLPAGSSSSAQMNHVSSVQPEIESPDGSDRTGRIESSVGNENQVKRIKRTSNPPDRFGSQGNDLEGLKKYKKGSTSSGGKEKGQSRQTVNADQWLANLNGVFEEINDYEMFFSQIDSESGDLKDVLKVTWDAEFYERQIKTKFSKVIAEGKTLIPNFRDFHDSQTIQKFEDLKKKVRGIDTLAKQQMEKLYCRYNAHKLTVEISELEDFMGKSLKDVTRSRRQKDEEGTTMEENQQSHQLLEKEIRWRQGRIEDIKKRTTPAALEIGDLKNRLKNVEANWAILVRNVEDEGKIYQFEKACKDNSNWFTNAIDIANNQDYGRDAKQTEALLQDFNMFMKNGTQNISELEGVAKILIDQGHPHSDNIQHKMSGVRSLSNTFREVAELRLNVLENLYIFSKQSDETIKFIEDLKKFVSVSLENCAVDLRSLSFQMNGHEEEEKRWEESAIVEMGKLNMAAGMITKQFPIVKENVAGKTKNCRKAWKELQALLCQRRKILNKAKYLPPFFEKYAQVMDKITFWMNKVNGIQLCRNVNAAGDALATCQSYEKEIREYGGMEELTKDGNRILEPNQLETSAEKALTDKLVSLRGKWDQLKRTVKDTLDLLKENVDTLVGIAARWKELQERNRLSELIGKTVENVKNES